MKSKSNVKRKRGRDFKRALGHIQNIVVFFDTGETDMVGWFIKFPGREGFGRVLDLVGITNACSTNPFHGIFVTARAEFCELYTLRSNVVENGLIFR